MTTPADTDQDSFQVVLERWLQLTDNHTHQLEAAAIAVQNLQTQVQPLHVLMESLTRQQAALAAQQAEIILQLQALTAARTNQPLNQPVPMGAGSPPPMDPFPVSPAGFAPVPREPCLSSPQPFEGD